MISRLLPLIMLLVLAFPGVVNAADGVTVISGGDLPHAVTLAAEDQDAFFRRINQPPVLDEAPPLQRVIGYRITSGYWAEALHDPDKPDAEPEATYIQAGGFVVARQDGEDVWLVLNLRQQAILNRYIRLTKAGQLGDKPGLLEVLTAASRTETIGIQVGSRVLSTREAGAFWLTTANLKPLNLPRDPAATPVAPHQAGASQAWITFAMPEGRSVQMLYTLGAGTMIDSLASEVYGVPSRWLEPVLGSEAPQAGQPGSAGAIEQEDSTGSLAWWLVMLGAGAGCIAVAAYLARRITTSAPAKS